ncbi:MAG TPA: murein L,D-transpeptidase catalytic domain family protein [Phenylobacterium sp.]|uniref:murein L,D-transpeptidase catalytic domain family protein n=1 Tax=Phenylobacterium sp. TaxID=1871053 RepID=UPI002F936426
MSNDLTASRRRLLKASLGALALGGATSGQALAAVSGAADRARAFGLAKVGLERMGGSVKHRDLVGLADFSSPSKNPRFHLLDMQSGQMRSLLVAHGRGSDPSHTGWVKSFSNAFGSAASSEGAYVTGDYYVGKHGRSMRLQGMDPGNSNAMARAIVVHGAWYVSPQMAKERGVLGRSEGCFAFAENDLPQVLERLGPGRLLLAGKF